MKIPVETKPAAWGFLVGAAALAFVGFSWGGWMTGGKAEAATLMRVDSAVVAALAPVCVERFQRGAEVSANLAALRKVESWSQGEFVEKGGWATAAGVPPPEQLAAVAKACAMLLAGPA